MEIQFKPIKIQHLILFALIFLFIGGLSIKVEAATLFLMPQSQTIYQGETFIVDLRLDTEDEEINSLEANLKFSTDLLETVEIGKGGSLLTLWVKEPSASQGKISFLGGVPGGFKGEASISKIIFLAKKIGEAKVDFQEDSQVLLNDGKGTPAAVIFLEGNYEIVSKPEKLPVISSSTHPDPNKWYNQNTLHLHWDLIKEAEYSFLLSQDSLTEPDNTPDKPEGELVWVGDMEYPDLEDGIYYFHLKQKLPNEDWSKKVTFRAMIDVTPPEEFKPEIGRDLSIFEGKYFLSFVTTDKKSGIDYYQIQEGKREFKKAESPYPLEDQSLRSVIKVKAIDKAGNGKTVEVQPSVKPFPYWIIILVFMGIVIIWWIIRKTLAAKRILVRKS